MSYAPQQSDIQLLNQSDRNVYSKIELLDKSFKTLEQLEGECIDDSYSYNSDSDIRKTYNLTLVVKNSSFIIGSNSKIWFDKYIKVYIGVYSIILREIVYYPVGIFLFESAGYRYDATTSELSLSCVDRMAELTGSRNGKFAGLSTVIESGASIRDALVDAITQLGGITKYRIEDIADTVPYNLEFNAGATVYDVIKELRDLVTGLETFFDDETFICQSYPTFESDPVVLDASTIDKLIISEDTTIDFTKIKNVIEIWGKCLETDYYTNSVSFASTTYSATYGTISALSNGTLFGFLAPSDNPTTSLFKVNSFSALPIVAEGNLGIAAGRIKSGRMYVLEYIVSGSDSYFYYCGEYQICSVVKLVSEEPSSDKKSADLLVEPTRNITYVIEPTSPFCSDLAIGEIREVFSDGEYTNIYSEDLATERTEYELWKATDLLDTITLELIEVPWLEVNQKIEYTSNTTGITDTYIVKTKSGSSTKGTMTITCNRFQPLYPWM